jgi:hypothetical protein
LGGGGGRVEEIRVTDGGLEVLDGIYGGNGGNGGRGGIGLSTNKKFNNHGGTGGNGGIGGKSVWALNIYGGDANISYVRSGSGGSGGRGGGHDGYEGRSTDLCPGSGGNGGSGGSAAMINITGGNVRFTEVSAGGAGGAGGDVGPGIGNTVCGGYSSKSGVLGKSGSGDFMYIDGGNVRGPKNSGEICDVGTRINIPTVNEYMDPVYHQCLLLHLPGKDRIIEDGFVDDVRLKFTSDYVAERDVLGDYGVYGVYGVKTDSAGSDGCSGPDGCAALHFWLPSTINRGSAEVSGVELRLNDCYIYSSYWRRGDKNSGANLIDPAAAGSMVLYWSLKDEEPAFTCTALITGGVRPDSTPLLLSVPCQVDTLHHIDWYGCGDTLKLWDPVAERADVCGADVFYHDGWTIDKEWQFTREKVYEKDDIIFPLSGGVFHLWSVCMLKSSRLVFNPNSTDNRRTQFENPTAGLSVFVYTLKHGELMPDIRSLPSYRVKTQTDPGGYTFGGFWDTKLNGGGNRYYNADYVLDSMVDGDDNTVPLRWQWRRKVFPEVNPMPDTLYARWYPDTTLLTYLPNEGHWREGEAVCNGVAERTKKAPYREDMPVLEDCFVPVREGFIFKGYYDKGLTKYYGYTRDGFEVAADRPQWDKIVVRDTLYAKWDTVIQPVRYYVLGGTDVPTPGNENGVMTDTIQFIKEGQMVDLLRYKYYIGSRHNVGSRCDVADASACYGRRDKTRYGYIFKGWSLDSGVIACDFVESDRMFPIGVGDSCGGFASVSASVLTSRLERTDGTEDVKLYAIWCPDTTVGTFRDNFYLDENTKDNEIDPLTGAAKCTGASNSNGIWNIAAGTCYRYVYGSYVPSYVNDAVRIVFGELLPAISNRPPPDNQAGNLPTPDFKFAGYYSRPGGLSGETERGVPVYYYSTLQIDSALWNNAESAVTIYARWSDKKYYIRYRCGGVLDTAGFSTGDCGDANACTTCRGIMSLNTNDNLNDVLGKSGSLSGYSDDWSLPDGHHFAGWKNANESGSTKFSAGTFLQRVIERYIFATDTIDLVPVFEANTTEVVVCENDDGCETDDFQVGEHGSGSSSRFGSGSRSSGISGSGFVSAFSFNVYYGSDINSISHYILVPSKVGYSFLGYFTGSGVRYFDSLGISARGDRWLDTARRMYLYGHWREHRYSIVYDTRGGSISKPVYESVGYDSSVLVPSYEGSRYGYYFRAWSLDSSVTDSVYISGSRVSRLSAVDGSFVKLYAVWASRTSYLSFNQNGGSEGQRSALSVKYGDLLPALTSVPRIPVLRGYSFKGYSYDGVFYYDGLGAPVGRWDREGSIVTLIAQWTANRYNIAYDVQGGSLPAPSGHINVSHDSSIVLANYYGLKTGYDFDGWSAVSGSKLKAYSAGGLSHGIGGAAGITATLYAAWKPHRTALSFEGNGGQFPVYLDGTLFAEYGERMPMFVIYPGRVGYDFVGLYDSAVGGTRYYDGYGNSVRVWDKASAASCVLYAHWSPRSCALQYNGNGGIGGPSGVYTVYYDGPLPELSGLPIRVGYKFLGFYDAIEGGVQYYDSLGVGSRVWDKLSRNVTLYARWQSHVTILDFDSNGGSVGRRSTIAVSYGSVMPSLDSLPVREGYVFGGYYDAPEYGVRYYDGYGQSVRQWDRDILRGTLYAQWGGAVYDIMYENVPPGLLSDLPVSYQVGVGLDLPSARHNQYNFEGYYSDSMFAGSAVSRLLLSDTGVRVFYMKWTYAIDYDINGGTGSSLPRSLHLYNRASSLYDVPSDWSRAGYEACLGWSTDPGAADAMFSGVGCLSAGLPAGKVVRLYGVWRAGKTRVILSTGSVSGGGFASGNPEVIAEYESSMPLLEDLPVREGYVFAGYYDSPDGGVQYYTSSGTSARTWDKVSNEFTLYARWVYERADNLQGLMASGGRFYPAFSGDVYDYDLLLPCDEVTLYLSYAGGNTVKVNGSAVGTSYVIGAHPAYSTLEIEVGSAGKASVIYTVRLDVPLSSSHISYTPDVSPRRMEVFEDAYDSYQWYEDGVALSDAVGSVLYDAGGFKSGSVYSVTGYVSDGDSVRICGRTAVAVQLGGEGKVLTAVPNPASTYITVGHPDLGNETSIIRIYSAGSGSLILSHTVEAGSANSVQIDISMLAGGSYILDVLGSRKMIVKQ